MIAKTIQPPYYAVIFTSLRTEIDEGYSEMDRKMEILAAKHPGFLGLESARNETGITISYWESLEAIKAWKANPDHMEAQLLGREKWYKTYKVRIVRVEHDYGFGL